MGTTLEQIEQKDTTNAQKHRPSRTGSGRLEAPGHTP
jgi:hypothetical protein